MTDMSVADVLERAANLIEEKGWTQGRWRSGEGCVCIEGAIGAVQGVSMIDVRYTPAGSFLEALLATPQSSRGPKMVRFNDAPERTQAEVVAKLRAAAALARQQSPDHSPSIGDR